VGLPACERGGPSVVLYTSVDDAFSRPIVERFEKETRIRVEVVFDAEAVKTTGLMNRLLREKGRPRADVFWSSEVAAAAILEEAGVLEPYASPEAAGIPEALRPPGRAWTGFAERARVLVYNKSRVSEAERPRSILDLADARFRFEAGISIPLFGTSATHAGALRARLGKERMEAYFRSLVENGVKVLAGNSVVRDRVASGELKIGLTDTDDACVALESGLPIGIVFPDQDGAFPGLDEPLGAFLFPTTAAIVSNGPHPEAARRLLDYLVGSGTEEALARSEAAHIPVRSGLAPPPALPIPPALRRMDVPAAAIARGLEDSLEFLEGLYLQ
jgi:iron(III) transport system substrate-binding protein